MDNIFDGLKFVMQYRRRDDGVAWRAMAAFDVEGAAEHYFAKHSSPDGPWEYRLFDVEANAVSSHQRGGDNG
jgi:hypothetical protein